MSCSHNAARLAALLLLLLARQGRFPRRISLAQANPHGSPTSSGSLHHRLSRRGVLDTIVALGHSEIEDPAARELALGWHGILRARTHAS